MSGNIFDTSGAERLKEELKLSDATPPMSIDELRSALKAIGDHSISTDSPFFMNQLFAGVLPQMLMAEELIAKTRTTLATFEASPVFTQIEKEIIDALGARIGWKKELRDGVCVPGGSLANFMAVHCARQKRFPKLKITGPQGERLKIFVSDEAHYSMQKACVALGLGTDALISVPTDAAGRMRADQLETLIQGAEVEGYVPLLVCATAGTTVLGAFDSIPEIAESCQKHGVWLHIDAAWGGPALFSRRIRDLVKGIELADSVTFDAHKFYGANLACSFFLTRHKGLPLEANDVSGGEYLFHADDEAIDHGKASWMCGRRADAVGFWAIWKSWGTEGMGQAVDRLLSVCDESLEWIRTQPRLELIQEPQFLNLCVRVKPPSADLDSVTWSQKVREELKRRGQAFVNYSSNEKGTFLRLILAHPELKTAHVRQILEWALAVESE